MFRDLNMSEHNPHHGHDPHDSEHGQVETSALSAKPVLAFLAVLFIATTFVFFVVKGLDWGFRELDEANMGQKATEVQTRDRKLPPEPLLQGAPGKGSTTTKDEPTELPLKEMERVRKSTDLQISSYGWVDEPGGVVRVPIDRAKAMIAEKGLPSLPSPTISDELQKAQKVRNEVSVAGSNGGRMISVQKPPQQPVQQPAPQSAQPQSIQPQQVPPHQQH